MISRWMGVEALPSHARQTNHVATQPRSNIMTTHEIAMEISEDSGLPLSDVIDMQMGDNNLEMALWDYPGSDDEALEECADADDFSFLDDVVGVEADFAADEIRESDITGHTRESYRRDAAMEAHDVSYDGQADDEPEWA